MRTWQGLAAASLAILLVSCTSMNADQCRHADWQTIGYLDGEQGRSTGAFERHGRSCAEHGVTADLDAYLAGRERGLEAYCRPSRGLRVGLDGGRYEGVCPPALESAFLAAYDAGRGLSGLRAAVASLEREIAQTREERDRLERDIGLLTAELVVHALGPTQREELGAQIAERALDLRAVADRLPGMELELRQRLDELEAQQELVRVRYGGSY